MATQCRLLKPLVLEANHNSIFVVGFSQRDGVCTSFSSV